MPALSSHQSSTITKLLLVGDSGSGKTGSLASLAQAGFNLRIIDMDSGLDVLANLLANSPALDRVVFETITDKMRNVNGRLIPAQATAWQRMVGLLTNWPELGPITSWGANDILVLDSFTMAGNAAMNFVQAMNSNMGKRPQQSEWGDAQNHLESLLQMLYDEAVKCNVIVTSHIAFIGEENGAVATGYPMALGKALPPKVGRYFNTILLARSSGAGASVKREILTSSTRMGSGIVELKNTNPGRVAPAYPLATGLADYFKAIRAGEGAGLQPPAKP
jgi:AAA domain-containing protein